MAVRIEVPVTPSDTLQVIWQQKLAPNTFSISHDYPPFDYDHNRGVFSDIVQPQQGEVKRAIERIKATARAYNESIRSEHPQFRPQMVNTRRDRMRQKHKNLDDLAAEVGIPLKKKADIATVYIQPCQPRADEVPTRER